MGSFTARRLFFDQRLAYRNYFLKVIYPRAYNLFLEIWLAYSCPVPANIKQLVTLIIVCALLSISNGLLLYKWLYSSLQYDYQPSAILSATVGVINFCILVLLHPIRCIVTIIIPTIGTKQGRRLLLSTCFMMMTFNIIPNIVTNVTNISQMIKCISQHSSERILNSTNFFEAVTKDVSRMVTEVIYEIDKINNFPFTPKERYVKISAHSETSLVEKQILKTTEKIKEDFLSIEYFFRDSTLVTNRILACFFIAYLLFNGSWYLKSYLTDVKFDNSYITSKLKKLAGEKKASQMLTCSSKRLIRSTGLKLSKNELWTCLFRMAILSLYMLPTALIIASDHVAFQFTMAVGNWIDDLPAMQISMQIQYNVKLMWFGAIRSYFPNHKEYPWNMTFGSTSCKTEASPPSDSITFTVGVIYCLMYVLIFLEAYAQRLRRKISASFYERQEDERVAYLFEKIMLRNKNAISTLE